MKITQITTQKRPGRYNIFIDGQFALAVSETMLVNLQLAKGQELTAQQLAELKDQEVFDRAYQQALNYLSYQLRTQGEMKQYLRQHDISPAVSQQVVSLLVQQQYLDDRQYAASFVRTAVKTTLDGPQKIRYKLQQKKLMPDVIEQALPLYSVEQQIQNATKLAQKCWRQNQRQPQHKRYQKVQQRLMTAGFASEVNSKVLAQLDLTSDEQAEQQLLDQAIDKLWPRYRTKDQGRRKLYAALMRRGFQSSQISAALENLK
ncbi:recombination regulator RecX [Bombilactobacillus folatiphilus]|uniref:Regulatory protein RecX n=1 Tax=Bombilactobacillus folatiphilus TaxID=2923362 RepID=A0ABY4P825_9LACO|nr:recombination regulator RecX [Bombilactobacillus folatiphilus]UQS81750.1 recombination regulator RecX [Bombilactobacillus folatiphilus]